MAREFTSITVGELRELLESEDDETIVTFASDYGDHCHTQQVHHLRGHADQQAIKESAYSDSGWALDKNADDDAATQTVLVIS